MIKMIDLIPELDNNETSNGSGVTLIDSITN